MNINLDINDLKALVIGTPPNYSEFNNPLVIKAGHSWSEQYSTTSWRNLNNLSEDELYQLYIICKNSW